MNSKDVLEPLINCFDQYLDQYQGQQFLIGLSGGLDSSLLALAASKSRHAQVCKLIHINHQLQQAADLWQDQVTNFAQQLGLELIVVKVKVAQGNLEALAREQRYQAIAQYGSNLITAHHQNDKLENFFLGLERGSGLRGLTSLTSSSYLEQYHLTIHRPLLNFNREELQTIAQALSLDYCDDAMNHDSSFTRVYWRQQLQKFAQQQATFISGLQQSQVILEQQYLLLQQLLTEKLDSISVVLDDLKLLDLNKIAALQDNQLLIQLLRFWLEQQQVILNQAQLEQLVKVALAPRTSKSFFQFKQFKQLILISRWKNYLLMVKPTSLTWQLELTGSLITLKGLNIFQPSKQLINYQLDLSVLTNLDLTQLVNYSLQQQTLTSQERKKLSKVVWWYRDQVPCLNLQFKDGQQLTIRLLLDNQAIKILA